MANKKTNSTKKSTTSTKKTATKPNTKNEVKTSSKKASTKKEVKVSNKKTTSKPAKKDTVKKVEKKETVAPVKEKNTATKKENKKEVIKAETLKNNYTIIGIVVIAILLIINIIIVSVGHKAKISDGKEVIASIKGHEFTADELFDKLKSSYGSDTLLNLVDEQIINKEITDKDKVKAKETAQENIDSLREQYESAGYGWEDVLKQYGYENEDKLLNEMILSAEKDIMVNNYLKKELKDDEIKKYYDENVYGKYTAKHILITPDTTDEMSDDEKEEAEDAAKEKAQEVIEKLNDGENWDDLVSEYSQDTGSVENKGLIENFTKGDVVDEFWDAVEKLKDNEYTKEPVKSSYGYHIIYRVSYTDKEAFDKIKDDLVDEIVEKKLADDANLYNSTWVNIRKNHKLKINDSVIQKAYENMINSLSN